MNGAGLMLKGFGVAYRGYMDWKFERLLQKAEAYGLTKNELYDSDQRFALYMRIGRAFESCSEKEVVDYLAEVMIGSIKCGDADERPDFAQMAIGSLLGVTRLELNILCFMQANQIYLFQDFSLYGQEEEDRLKRLYLQASEELEIELSLFNSVLGGLSRTGLVSPPVSGAGGVIVEGTSRLTSLARELFRYVDYNKRLTN